MELRDYQRAALRALIGATTDSLLELPTGGGKTLILATAAAQMLRDQQITHAIIIAPQLQIADGFLIDAKVNTGAVAGIVDLHGKIREMPTSKKTKALSAYLNSVTPGYALACSHQAARKLKPAIIPNLSSAVLVVDEAHHIAPKNELGKFVKVWRERGGRVVFASATPFRADLEPVALEGMQKVYSRSLAEHMDAKACPAKLHCEIVPVDIQLNFVVERDEEGDDAVDLADVDAGKAKSVAKSLVAKWLADEKPKTIVRLPTVVGGSQILVSAVAEAFTEAGARVLDATGEGKSDRNRVVASLREERPRSYGDSQFDVVIGIQRVMEGTDWPHCSSVYVVGIPGSLAMAIQLLGRAMRKKPTNYPARHRDVASLVFFATNHAVDDMNYRHSRDVLLLSTFLADAQAGQAYLFLRQRHNTIISALSHKPGVQTTMEKLLADFEAKLGESSPAISFLRAGITSLLARGKGLTFEELPAELNRATYIQAIPFEHRAEAIRRTMAIIALQQDGQRAAKAVGRSLNRSIDAGTGGDEALEAAFNAIFDEFRTATVVKTEAQQEFENQIHALTAGTMVQFVERLRECIASTHGDPIPLADLHEAILSHHEHNGWPAVNSGVCVIRGETTQWCNINQALICGYRGFPKGSSLLGECQEVARRHNLPAPTCTQRATTTFDDADVRAAVKLHCEQTGKYPTATTEGMSSLGLAWKSVANYMHEKNPRYIGSSTLSEQTDLVRVERGDRPLRQPELTIEQVHTAIAAYNRVTGEWPSRALKVQADGLGVAWNSLSNMLNKGQRGLPGGSTLAKEVAHVKAALPAAAKSTDLAHAAIDAAIMAYFQANGERPTKSLTSKCSLGIQWGSLHNHLQKGGRGLPGGDSLAKRCDQLKLPKLRRDSLLAMETK